MTQHTPGPWKADDRAKWYPWPETFGICAGDRTIAWTTSDAANRERDIADAALIAAAPDLLAALKALSSMYGSTWDRVDGALVMMDSGVERFEKAHQLAKDAIDKAGGKQ